MLISGFTLLIKLGFMTENKENILGYSEHFL